MTALCVIATALLLGPVADDPASTGDLAKLQGTWRAKIGPNKDVPFTIFVNRDKAVAVVRSPDGKEITTQYTIKLDEKASPKILNQTNITIDFGNGDDEMKAAENPAIYELNGDEWKLGLVAFGEPRPKSFKDVDPLNTIVLKRVKPDR